MIDQKLTSAEKTSVWIVEDSPVFRKSFVSLLNASKLIMCTGVFKDFEELETQLNARSQPAFPDVILMDIQLGDGKKDGVEATRYLVEHYPDLKIVMLTLMDDTSQVRMALEAGAKGYLLKESLDQHLELIHEAAQGHVAFSKPIGQKVLGFFHRSPHENPYGLTRRQKEVLRMMTRSLTQKQIAEKLFISPDTVSNHIRSIYEKLNVHSQTAAISKAIHERLV